MKKDKNTKLEKKILDSIYIYESKQTKKWVIKRLILIGVFLAGSVYFALVVISILSDQGTFDVFELFGEDFDLIREYFLGALDTFFQELPLPETIIFILFLFITLLLLFKAIKNSKKIVNKLLSIKKYLRVDSD